MATVRLTLREVERSSLPDVCSLTGEPTEERSLISFRWTPVWVYLIGILCGGGVLFFVLFMVLTKRMNVNLPIHAEKKRALFIPKIAMIVGVLAGFLTLIAAGATSEAVNSNAVTGSLLGVGVLLILAAIIVGRVMLSKVVHATAITDDAITLGGVHENFAEALDEYREARKERARQRRAEEEATEAAEQALRPVIKARKVEPKPPTILRAKRVELDEEAPPRRRRREDEEDEEDRPRRRREGDE